MKTLKERIDKLREAAAKLDACDEEHQKNLTATKKSENALVNAQVRYHSLKEDLMGDLLNGCFPEYRLR